MPAVTGSTKASTEFAVKDLPGCTIMYHQEQQFAVGVMFRRQYQNKDGSVDTHCRGCAES